MPQPSVTEILWKITYLKLNSNFPGVKELTNDDPVVIMPGRGHSLSPNTGLWISVNTGSGNQVMACCLADGLVLSGNWQYSRVSNNSVDTLIKTALDFPWCLAYLIPPRLLKFSKFSILYIPTDVILRCLTRYRVTRSFIRLTVRPFFGGFSRSRLHSGVQYKSFIASIWFMPPNAMKLHQ